MIFLKQIDAKLFESSTMPLIRSDERCVIIHDVCPGDKIAAVPFDFESK